MVLFRIIALVLVGFVASASVKSSKKEEIEGTGTRQLIRAGTHEKPEEIEGTGTKQLVREGRHGPLQIVPQAWYENALVAVSFLFEPTLSDNQWIILLFFLHLHLLDYFNSPPAFHPKHGRVVVRAVCLLDARKR